MKRDPNLIRQIALATEALKPSEVLSGLPGIDPQTFGLHVQMLLDAGFADVRVVKDSNGQPRSAAVIRLTWAGADFLDAARSETIWRKAQTSVIAPTASWTFDILLDWLREEIKQGLPAINRLV